jgi:hypothetical protein
LNGGERVFVSARLMYPVERIAQSLWVGRVSDHISQIFHRIAETSNAAEPSQSK